MRIFSFLTISVLLAANAAAQTVVPGPWGNTVDPVEPRAFDTEADRIVHARREQMKAMSAHFRFIEAVLVHEAPFQDLVPSDAAALMELAARLDVLFPEDTAMEPGGWGARPAIWEQPERFADHVEGFRLAVTDLQAAIAEAEDQRAAFDLVRHQCLACHENFRERRP